MSSTERAVRFGLGAITVIIGVIFLVTNSVFPGVVVTVLGVLALVMTAMGLRRFGDLWRRR